MRDGEVLKDGWRMVITPPTGVGDEIQITKHADGSVTLEINEPWAGSTETGFGATTSIKLPPYHVEELRKFLTPWLVTGEGRV